VQAESEILAAQDWYDERATGLGFEFARMVDAAIALLSRNPHQFQRIGGEYRRVLLRRFPYMLIYTIDENSVFVLSCFHQRQEPETWKKVRSTN
jgi:plasmid stabilization system protein ParE